jgi:hypothetical protein
MALLQKRNKQEDIQAQIENEIDNSFEYSLGEEGVLTQFVEDFDEKFQHVPAYLPLANALIMEMMNYNMSIVDMQRVFLDALENFIETDEDDEDE